MSYIPLFLITFVVGYTTGWVAEYLRHKHKMRIKYTIKRSFGQGFNPDRIAREFAKRD